MVVCDACSRGKPMLEWALATRRVRVHNVNQDGGESFSTRSIDLCEDHYQQLIVAPLTQEDVK